MSLTRNKKLILTAGYLLTATHSLWAFTPVQQPPETSAVPGNLLFALSVEFPTGLQASYNVSNYGASLVYDGYFDNSKCYTYNASTELFSPTSVQNSDADKTCPTTPSNTQWSGNLLNWLTMTNIDQFRSVMTGGTRDTVSALSTVKGGAQDGDSATNTVLIRSFSDRNNYHTNKWLPNTAAVPAAYRGALVRNGGYGTKIMVVPPANSTQEATVRTERDCRRTPGGTRISCWTNNTGNTVTVVYAGTSTVVTNGSTWYHSNNTRVDITYSWTTTTTPSNSSFSDMDAAQRQLSCAASPLPTGGSCFNVRVTVCKTLAGAAMESNCKGYRDSSKPEGLVQQYANALRYGAFGYLKHDGTGRNGGVLRAAMKSVGKDKAVGDGSVEPNTNKEWDETTGVQTTNPDASDATASSVSRSGVINYLNQFGYASGYKGNDPVGELYYAALTYLRGKAPPADYTSDLTDERKDGFPVITGAAHRRDGSRDPMINTCQKNFLLTIGDIFTWNDTDISDSEFNVVEQWNKVATLEGSSAWYGGASNAGPYIAGMAYWAHTQDIRDDLEDPKEGPQTVASYFVDVLENYNNRSGASHDEKTLAASRLKTQYWLAAKYGGYDKEKAKTAGNELSPNADRTSWDADASGTSGYDVPDTWFAGNSPLALKAGLASAFSKIVRDAGSSSSSSAATTSSRQTSNSQIIYAGYDPQNWTGSVLGCKWKTSGTLPADAEKRLPNKAECTDTAKTYVTTWDAADWLNEDVKGAQALTFGNRHIISARPDADTDVALVTGQAFRWASISSAQQSILTAGEDQLNFLRGDRDNENVLFRKRPATLLGDIVHSGVTHVAGASYPLTGNNYSNHSTYRTATRSRPSVVYVGANDGMLHAFSATDGKELFAYIPQAVFANLPKLSAQAFTHGYFIDSTPMVGDIETGTNGLGTWKTYLVGGLGAGGKGYYALDISSQSSFASMIETDFATKLPKWEFTSVQDADMGYSFNEPSIHPVTGEFLQIAKVADASVETGVWRVIVGNGYGSTDGKAILYMLNATTGGAANKLTADAPTTKDNGLSTPTPVDSDDDGLVDTIYAGDLKGNMHKFQFSKLVGAKYVVANPTDTGAAWRYLGKVYASGEPIVSAPAVALSCKGTGLNVAFGTGKLNEVSDYTDTAARSFISLQDIGDTSSLTVPASDLATISLTQDTLENGDAVRKWDAPTTINKGWKMTFTAGERVLGNATQPPKTGAIVFGTTKPSGDVCKPGNSAYLMSVTLCSGAPALQVDGHPDVGGYASDSAGEYKVSNSYLNPEGNPTTVDNQENEGHELPTGTAPKGRYSWRELLTK